MCDVVETTHWTFLAPRVLSRADVELSVPSAIARSMIWRNIGADEKSCVMRLIALVNDGDVPPTVCTYRRRVPRIGVIWER